MSASAFTLCLEIDRANPGHFFACGGLFEVAHRIWPGTEGWFAESSCFVLQPCSPKPAQDPGQTIIESLRRMKLCSLSEEQQKERETLEHKKRIVITEGKQLAEQEEERRKELGELARAGPLYLNMSNEAGDVFSMRLDWWQNEVDPVPKTWAGRQEVHKVARAAQDALEGVDGIGSMFDYACVLRMPKEYQGAPRDSRKRVEPFYFDARRFAHALDTGFSLDAVSAMTVAHPAVELLALIGLQRFQPAFSRGEQNTSETTIKARFDYYTWHRPLGIIVAAAAAAGAAYVPGCRHYQFKILARDDQKRYGAFGWATTKEGGPS